MIRINYVWYIRPLMIQWMILLLSFRSEAQNTYPFQNPALPVDVRVEDLVSRLTLREKAAQLFNQAPAIERLGIPAYNWWNECLHGVARAGKATVFPQAIGLSASFNESLMHTLANAISDEARAKHNFFLSNNVRSIYTGLTFWTPNINIFRDPRWGRGQETYGEDPYLTGRMAVNFIKGLQGDDPDHLKVIATAKHYAVHSGPEFSRHTDNVFVNDRDLYETYLPAFKAAVKEANVQSVMCAYNRFRDQPCCGSDLLLTNILRNEFGFNGYVVSDCGAITDFYVKENHGLVPTPSRAWGWSVAAGTDLNCEVAKAFLEDNLDSAIQAGVINEKDINRSVMRLFRARFLLGMFDPKDKQRYAKLDIRTVGSVKNRTLALSSAEQAMVLLKNDGILPLKSTGKIALIGPNANSLPVLLGNYNGNPIDPVTPLDAFKKLKGEKGFFYSAGGPIVPGVFTNQVTVPNAVLFHEESGKLKNGLQAKYFHGSSMEGKPALQRIDSAISFNWDRTPISSKIEESFSVEWKGILKPGESGHYKFGGNVSLLIDGKKIGQQPVFLEKGKSYSIQTTLVIAPFWWGNTIEPSASLTWVNTSTDFQAEANAMAAKADVIIFCGGISPNLEGEEMPLVTEGFEHGDRTDLNLPAIQEDLLKALKKTGKPIVYVNFSGSAIALNWEQQELNAIIQAFYPGEATGTALVNLLYGKTNFSGKLPVTFYHSVKDLPDFKDYNMTGRTYRYFKGEPLYPFGFGLSYTHFDFQWEAMPEHAEAGKPLSVKVKVSNIGNREGSDIVQLYLSHIDSKVPVPQSSLVAFKRVSLKPGESSIVEFSLTPEQYAMLDESLKWNDAPGKIRLWAGDVSPGPNSTLINRECMIMK